MPFSGNRERPHRRRQVAAVAAPVDEGGIDRNLPVQVIHVVIGLRTLRDDHALAGARRRPAHAVGVLRIRIGTADDAHQQRIARRTGHLRSDGQILQPEEHALRRATAHVGGGNSQLRRMSQRLLGHGQATLFASRKSWANRCNTPPAS
jgi:hypothetical protein